MTVTQIVNDLLEHKMITTEAALVLLKAEAESIAFRNQGNQGNQGLQTFPYNPPFKVGDMPSDQPFWYTTSTGTSSKIEE